jgi:nucleolar protein 6
MPFQFLNQLTRTEKHNPDTTPTLSDKPQRYSSTSGIDQRLEARRTWTVGDSVEGETHRGGKKHTRARQIGRKTWGTGVNAIPVN